MARRTKTEIMDGVDCIESKIVANNTVEYRKEDGIRVIRLHLTDIVTFNPDGSVTLNSDGWQTVTTKARMNEFFSGYVYQDKSIWYVENAGKIYVYKDGITFYPDGSVTGEGEDPKEKLKLKKDVKKYVDGYMKALINREVDKPSGGDCWGCFMTEQNGREVMGNDHIFEHFKEKYYVPSLLNNAIKELPVSQAAMHMIGYYWKIHNDYSEWYEGVAKEQIKKSLSRYITRRLGMAA